MGEQVKELFSWARRRKILAAAFVAFTLTVGILIGSVISGRVSAMKTLAILGRERDAAGGARSRAVVQFVRQHCKSRGAGGREHRHDAGARAAFFQEAALPAVRPGRSHAGFLRPFL